MNKKAQMDNLIKYIIWIVVFIVAGVGLTYMLRKFGVFG